MQDNSYRNETFATVSGIPLADVNALEVFFFNALHYNVVVDAEDWESWIATLKGEWIKGVGQGKDMGHYEHVAHALNRLQRVAATRTAGLAPHVTHSPITPLRKPMARTPSTPLTSTAMLISTVDLDGSGPLRSPLRFDTASEGARAVHRVYAEPETPTRVRLDPSRR